MLAETVGAIVADGKHPPAGERLATLWATLPRRYGANFTVLTSWADQLNELLNRIGDGALRERESRRQMALATMDTIFREHPATSGPERDMASDVAMLKEVNALLATAPSAVLEAVAANLVDGAEYERLVVTTASPTELASREKWRRHSIAHFIARNLPPKVRVALGVTSLV